MNYTSVQNQKVLKAVADPGFPRGGGANFRGGRQHTILPKFSKKLHEIERIWTGGGVPRAPLERNPLICVDET